TRVTWSRRVLRFRMRLRVDQGRFSGIAGLLPKLRARIEEAHRVAGYRADRRNAQHLRQGDDISRRIEELLAKRDKIDVRATERAIERTAITKQRVIEELAKIGFANMANYTRLVGSERVVDLADASLDHLAAVQEIVVEDFKDGRGENARDVRRVKLKLHDKKG